VVKRAEVDEKILGLSPVPKLTDDQERGRLNVELKRLQSVVPTATISYPPYWLGHSRRSFESVRVKINPNTKEYETAATFFWDSGCSKETHDIISIELNQCPFLWQGYATQRCIFEQKFKKPNVERLLFYFAKADEIETICTLGFIRDCVRKHVNGQGVYFFTQNSAANVGTIEGNQVMFTCRVLVGEYHANSDSSRRQPDRKNQADPNELYDSMVDNTANPSTFVICRDFQSYPEFIITFKHVRRRLASPVSPVSPTSPTSPTSPPSLTSCSVQ